MKDLGRIKRKIRKLEDFVKNSSYIQSLFEADGSSAQNHLNRLYEDICSIIKDWDVSVTDKGEFFNTYSNQYDNFDSVKRAVTDKLLDETYSFTPPTRKVASKMVEINLLTYLKVGLEQLNRNAVGLRVNDGEVKTVKRRG